MSGGQALSQSSCRQKDRQTDRQTDTGKEKDRDIGPYSQLARED